jgi:hypothetical protein
MRVRPPRRGGRDWLCLLAQQSAPDRSARSRGIGRALPALLTAVGVFVNASPRDVSRAVARGATGRCATPRRRRSLRPTCRAARPSSKCLAGERRGCRRGRSYSPAVTLLVDAKDVERRGGTACRANWHFAQRLARVRRFFSPAACGRRTWPRPSGPCTRGAWTCSSGVEDAARAKECSADRRAVGACSGGGPRSGSARLARVPKPRG